MAKKGPFVRSWALGLAGSLTEEVNTDRLFLLASTTQPGS